MQSGIAPLIMVEKVKIADEWLPAPEHPVLRSGTVDIWIAILPEDAASEAIAAPVLSDDERERASRFRFQRDRVRYIAGRAFLRQILARYSGLNPEAFCFRYNEYGKPFVHSSPPLKERAGVREQPGGEIEFNLAHSRGLAIYGFATGVAIGVDIEAVRPDIAAEEIAERFFAPKEREVLRRLPAENRTSAFFECWTRKEAFIKARGMGLSLALDQFEVGFGPGVRPALLSVVGDPDAGERWHMSDLRPADGFAGALAVEGKVSEVRLWRFQ